MSLSVITGPATEPVTLAEAKLHCRVDNYELDGRIAGLILAAREWAQEFTGRRIMSQTLELRLDEFPAEIALPVAPVQSITSIKYIASGVEATLSSAAYESDLVSPIPRIRLASGYSWPSVDVAYNAVRVRFVAGHAESDAALHLFREAILLHVQAHFDRDQRELEPLMKAAHSMIWPLRLLV